MEAREYIHELCHKHVSPSDEEDKKNEREGGGRWRPSHRVTSRDEVDERAGGRRKVVIRWAEEKSSGESMGFDG